MPNRHVRTATRKIKLHMQENRERWMELAELAANEQDPKKFMELIHEINELLDKKQKRLNDLRIGQKPRLLVRINGTSHLYASG
jgi:hypothetical protein